MIRKTLPPWMSRHAAPTVMMLALVASASVQAQTIGIATMQPGTISYTTASALAKVLHEQARLNTLVQPTAGESIAIAMVANGEAELGLAQKPELAGAIQAGRHDLRLIAPVHPLRVAFFVRKDSAMQSVSDVRGKRVAMGYSAMRVIDSVSRAILATGGLTDKDVSPVLVPNVIRSAEDFTAGAADMFYFALGSPKVREVDATVGGVRALQIPSTPGIAAAQSVLAHGYLTEVSPSPALIGVTAPMKVYTFDNLLFTHAKVSDAAVYKMLETLLAHRDQLVAVQPAMREFAADRLYVDYDIPYHPGALKYFRDKSIAVSAVK